MTSKLIVVVGASGNIGTALLHKLRGSPHEVTAVARRTPMNASADDVHWVACDAAETGLDTVASGADVIVNLAWLLQPSHDPDLTWANNIGVMRRVLAAMSAERVPALVYTSSVATYSPGTSNDRVDESWPTHGASSASYAVEKAYLERMLDAFEAAHPECRVVRMRPAFVFQRPAATEQRRLFAGPLLPGRLVRPATLPILPVPSGLRLQAIHADDVAEALVRAIEPSAQGAYNLAAPEVLDGADLAALFEARQVRVPSRLVRAAASAAWHLHAAPSPPDLFDALLRLPLMSTRRAEEELGWCPTVSAADAVQEFLVGLRHGDHYPTPPLDGSTSGRLPSHEFRTGVGSRP